MELIKVEVQMKFTTKELCQNKHKNSPLSSENDYFMQFQQHDQTQSERVSCWSIMEFWLI